MEHIDRHFVDHARRVVEAEQLRRDLHRIAMEQMQAPGPHPVAVVNPPGIAVGLRPQREAERVRSTPVDPAG
jgi:hypothetical protein